MTATARSGVVGFDGPCAGAWGWPSPPPRRPPGTGAWPWRCTPTRLWWPCPGCRHVDLDRVEDELDAYVCAHVALSMAADLNDAAGRLRVLGEWGSGAIVTPVDSRQEALLASATMGRWQGG